MPTFYKYYDSFIESLILNPTIKLSSPMKLNDPFEKTISREVIEQYKVHSRNRKNINEIKKECEEYIHTSGIISLTENPRSLLMWAHYGNDHKGVCIGYKSEFITHNSHAVLPSSRPFHAHPIKVNYDKVRFDEHTDDIRNINGDDLLNAILLKTLTTKGDDWIYEKEHRCILPIEWCDKLLISKPRNIEAESEHYWVVKEAIKRKILCKKADGFYYPVGDMPDNLIKYISRVDEVTILKRIDSSSIDSIFIGCEARQGLLTKIKTSIRNNPEELGHIRVFKYRKDRSKFEILAREIDPFKPTLRFIRKNIVNKEDIQEKIFG
ncbi:DUF2971 domain-containing protein [Aeromonas dhakensis]|uniref:DUF2971 domain-containing protein n=1 Tax=Aeromonas dhakensis TaxID=196024 RepID=UPI003F84FAD0